MREAVVAAVAHWHLSGAVEEVLALVEVALVLVEVKARPHDLVIHP